MQPTVGRIVHYQRDLSPEPLAAIVTRVREVPADVITPTEHHAFTVANVDLAVYTGNGVVDLRNVPYSQNPRGTHWNWPPRDDTPTVTHGRFASDC